MKTTNLFCTVMLAMAMTPGSTMVAQVQTIVPPVVEGAKPAIVEHIKIHGTALEGNLEGTRSTATSLSFCRRATTRTSIAATR